MILEEQLRDALAPCEPGPAAEAAVMAHVFGGAKRAARRKPSRHILFGAILIAAAAAAILLVTIARPPAPATALVVAPAPPIAVVAEAAAAPESAVEPQPVESVASVEPVAAVAPFTAQLMPLVNEATEPSASVAIQTVYATFVDRLRAVPGLTLLQQDQTEGASQVRPDFRITLRGREYGKVGDSGPNQAMRDPAVLRAAVDLGTTAADPLQRARVWSLLRGVSNAELARPLLTALRQDNDGDVRLAALGALVAGFREDERFQPALETAAQRDARPLVRALARRVLDGAAGEAAWRDYMTDSLKDAKRPAVERIEALFYEVGMPTTTAYVTGSDNMNNSRRNTLRQLDGAALQALTEALTAAAESSPVVQRSASMLWTDLGQIDHPVITNTLLASLNDGGHGIDRVAAASVLGQLPSRRDDPRVRAALEKLSAGDPDPRMREVAAKALQQPAAPIVNVQAGTAALAPAAGQPRFLGIGLSTVEAASFAPKELVGRTLVTAVGSGTVAQKAGLLEGDVLLEINGTPLQSPAAIPGILATIPGDVEFDLLVNRRGENLKLKARF